MAVHIGLPLPLGETVQHSKIVPYQHCINGNDWILLASLTRIDNLMSKTRDRIDVRVALLICLKKLCFDFRKYAGNRSPLNSSQHPCILP